MAFKMLLFMKIKRAHRYHREAGFHDILGPQDITVSIGKIVEGGHDPSMPSHKRITGIKLAFW